MSNDKPRRGALFRLTLFPFCAILIFVALNVAYSFVDTLHRLDAVEAERDQWQRPLDLLRATDLREGNTVVDLGSGAGYFALKLSRVVGKRGQVLAVDLRRLSLLFLWTRAMLRGQHNIHVIVGEEDNPHLPTGAVDGVLICNAYHELSNPERVLSQIFGALRPGGRVVIVDRAPGAIEAEHTHDIPLVVVESQLQRRGFTIMSRDNHFIDRRGEDSWWLLVAQKP